MANEVLTKNGTQIVWANSGDFGGSPIARTHQIDLTSVATGEAREGAKADLGATRAARYSVTLRIELDAAATSGLVVDFYFGQSPHGTAATANPGGLTGADADYAGTAGDAVGDSIKQCSWVGSLPCTSDADGVIQQATWVFMPSERYVIPVVYNLSGQVFEGDAVEMSIIMTPIIDEIQ